MTECPTCNFAGCIQGTCGTSGCKARSPLACRCLTHRRTPIRAECLIHGPIGPNLCGAQDGGHHENGAHWNEAEKTCWPCPVDDLTAFEIAVITS